MPTDVLVALEERRLAKKKEAADLRAFLLLIPMIACLLSIILSVESRAFECAVLGVETGSSQGFTN
jgi:hypothetical protein